MEILKYEKTNGYSGLEAGERSAMEAYCRRYMDFLDRGKTIREVTAETAAEAEKHGFVPFQPDKPLSPGDRVFFNNRGKSVIFAVIGKKSLAEGCRIAVAHGDSPCLDLKPNPLYESEELALLRTHYYGGVKKYQWVTIPLALHGQVCMTDGTSKNVCLGEEPDEPVLYISDLLIHLSNEQMDKKMKEGVTGEKLCALAGSEPLAGIEEKEEKEPVKAAVLRLLNERYGMLEADFLSAELSLVPAGKSRIVGLDGSMIGAYGHDDRICAYGEFEPLLDMKIPEYTAVCLIADKEEIGSVGISGMQSHVFDHFMEDLCEAQGVKVRRCLENSLCMSADVTNAIDPLYTDATELQNNARLNYGVAVCKYTGHGGKSGASDASAEVVARFRHIFDEADVKWQMADMGRIDLGGGGTVAGYMANRGIETLDVGVPLLSMHAPMEIASKYDAYMMRKAASAFYESR